MIQILFSYTSQIPTEQLQRSHIMQYSHGYCKFGGAFEGTLRVLCTAATVTGTTLHAVAAVYPQSTLGGTQI